MKSKENNKVSFGKYAVLEEVTYNFKKEPDWYWIIKPLNVSADIQIQQLVIANQRFITGSDGDAIPLPASNTEVKLYHIAATFNGSNIPNPNGGEGLFIEEGEKMTSILSKLRNLPDEIFEELWEAVVEANPHLSRKNE